MKNRDRREKRGKKKERNAEKLRDRPKTKSPGLSFSPSAHPLRPRRHPPSFPRRSEHLLSPPKTPTSRRVCCSRAQWVPGGCSLPSSALSGHSHATGRLLHSRDNAARNGTDFGTADAPPNRTLHLVTVVFGRNGASPVMAHQFPHIEALINENGRGIGHSLVRARH